jgi:Zn-dependent protease with chaperone function
MVSLAGSSQLEVFKAWRPDVADGNSQRYAKASRALNDVLQNAGVSWRYSSAPGLRVLQGDPDSPNAFCTGSSVFVTAGLVDLLDEQRLRAVLAHEMAHAERGHLTQRLGFPVAASLLHFAELVRSDWRALWNGEIDAFMREALRSGQWAMIQSALESATLGQELEADCDAAGWLAEMSRRGRAQSPRDILEAFRAIIGIPLSEFAGDPFLGPRVRQLQYDGCSR